MSASLSNSDYPRVSRQAWERGEGGIVNALYVRLRAALGSFTDDELREALTHPIGCLGGTCACRRLRKLGPNLSRSALLRLMNESPDQWEAVVDTLVQIPKPERRKRLKQAKKQFKAERQAREESKPERGMARLVRALKGEHPTRSRRAA